MLVVKPLRVNKSFEWEKPFPRAYCVQRYPF
jgi:hypothetical protein